MPHVSSQRRVSIRRMEPCIKSGDQISNVNTLIHQIDRKISCYYRDMLPSVTPTVDRESTLRQDHKHLPLNYLQQPVETSANK